jgi:phage minor tail protein G
MSLWHGHPLKGSQGENAAAEVAKIQDEVMQTWPTELIAEAEFKVKLLSGMIAPVTDDPAEPGEERMSQLNPLRRKSPRQRADICHETGA